MRDSHVSDLTWWPLKVLHFHPAWYPQGLWLGGGRNARPIQTQQRQVNFYAETVLPSGKHKASNLTNLIYVNQISVLEPK